MIQRTDERNRGELTYISVVPARSGPFAHHRPVLAGEPRHRRVISTGPYANLYKAIKLTKHATTLSHPALQAPVFRKRNDSDHANSVRSGNPVDPAFAFAQRESSQQTPPHDRLRRRALVRTR